MLSNAEQEKKWGPLPTNAYLALALDIGTKKIGIAKGQSLLANASPVGNIKANDASPAWAELENILKQWKPDLIIIGWPMNMDGSPTFLSEACTRAANKIHGRYALPVRLADERLSTREAYDIALSDPDANWKNQNVDALAAVAILETWFNSTAT